MPANVVPFRALERSARASFVEGEAFCIACDHVWEAIAEVGTYRLECPQCHAIKGTWRYECVPSDALVQECACGNQLFYLTEQGHLCPNCGIYQRYD